MGEFRRQLTYEVEWYGNQVVTVDRFYPFSQLCSVCGAQWTGTKDLAVRERPCPECGTVHNKEHNAAKTYRKKVCACWRSQYIRYRRTYGKLTLREIM